MKKFITLVVLMLVLMTMMGCEEAEPLKIFGLDEEKITEAKASDTGYVYRYVTEYKGFDQSMGVMEVVVYTDEEYQPTDIDFNPIGANNLQETMNPKDARSIYGLVNIQGKSDVNYSIISEQVLLDYFEANPLYTVLSTSETSDDKIDIELMVNENFNLFLAYEFEIDEENKGILILE